MPAPSRPGADSSLDLETWGLEEDPAILVLHDGSDEGWRGAAERLTQAGRRMMALNCGRGGQARARAVLARMSSRPAVLAWGAAGEEAAVALMAEEAAAVGFVFVDPASPPPPTAAPVLVVGRRAPPVVAPGAETTDVSASPPDEREEALEAALVDFLERRLPREPIHYRAGSDPRTLRDALGCFATGVTVVTTRDADGRPLGLTANSFTSVSLDPPLILFCLAKTSGSLERFAEAGHFAVNVLHIGQQPVSSLFARRAEDRFRDVAWETWDTDAPILTGCLASFECASDKVVDAGDHLVFIGRVTRARFEPHRDPLLYFRGRYRRLHFA